MTRHLLILLLTAAAATLLASCQADEPGAASPALPVRIIIPMEPGTRAIADPGSPEGYKFPRHAYVWAVTKHDGANEEVFSLRTPLIVANWKLDEPRSAASNTLIYYYDDTDQRLSLPIPYSTDEARVYAAVADRDFLPASLKPANEDAVKAITFDFNYAAEPETGPGSPTELSPNSTFLKNLYSTPADLKNDKNDYYGTVYDFSTFNVRVDMVCYHVASKLDLTWNIADPHYLSRIVVKGLYHSDCSLFHPALNTDVNTSDTYTETITTGPGSQWLGRESVYIIQRRDRTSLDLDLHLHLNGADAVTTKPGTATLTSSSMPEIYTPWLRGKIKYPNP